MTDRLSWKHWLIGALLFGGFTFCFLKTQSFNQTQHYEIVNSLKDLRQQRAALIEDSLRIRMGLLQTYDSLVSIEHSAAKTSTILKSQFQELGSPHTTILTRALNNYDHQLDRDILKLEHFKSANSIVRNSLRYLPLAYEAAGKRLTDTRSQSILNSIFQKTLIYATQPDTAVRASTFAEVENLETTLSTNPDLNDVHAFLKHSITILENEERIDAELTSLAQKSNNLAITDLSRAYDQAYASLSLLKNRYQIVMYLLFILVLIYLANVVAKLHGAFARLRDMNAELEQRVADRTADLEATHSQLLQTAHQAGMAEIATGVLHNVGNVLNSVNVSVDLIETKIKHSKIENVSKVSEMFSAHTNDLASFITIDEKGKQLPLYLSKISEVLRNEHANLLKELHQLKCSIEHVKEIVNTQQSYAKSKMLLEKIKPAEVVRDAMRMSESALTRHDVKIETEFLEVPDILADRHKIIQILMNLMSNAKQALVTKQSDKIMTVRVARHDERYICFSIRDNGIGISAETMKKLFTHGFTTRTEGHGFGLHSSLLAAKGLSGSLAAHSEGDGKGSIFTLLVPINNQKET